MSIFSLQVVIQAIAKTALGKGLTDIPGKELPEIAAAISNYVPAVAGIQIPILDADSINTQTGLPKAYMATWSIAKEDSIDAMTSDSEKGAKAARPKRGRQERPKLPGCPFVLISPVLPDDQSLQHFFDVIRQIPQALTWKANSSTALKIYVGKSDGYSLRDLKWIAKCYLKYENDIDLIHARASRKVFAYKKTEIYQRSCLDSAYYYFGKTDIGSLMAGIDGIPNRHEVVVAVNRDMGMDGFADPSYKVNFTGIDSQGKGAIGFGQGVGTVDPEIMKSWMNFCVKFVTRAVSLEGDEEGSLAGSTMTWTEFIPNWDPPKYPALSGQQVWVNVNDSSDRDDSPRPESLYVGSPRKDPPVFSFPTI